MSSQDTTNPIFEVSPMASPRLAVLVSGTGRTLRNLHERIQAGTLSAQLVGVASSRDCVALDWAQSEGIEARQLIGNQEAQHIETLLDDFQADICLLAGYTKLVPIPEKYKWRVVNIHPSLLPSFGGPGMYGGRVHAAVLDAGCRVSGCTVHLCDGAYDRGPIVAQSACVVDPSDSPERLASRVFELEKELYPAAVAALSRGYRVIEGRVELEEHVAVGGSAAAGASLEGGQA